MPCLLCLDAGEVAHGKSRNPGQGCSQCLTLSTQSSSPRTEGWPLAPPATLQIAKQEVPLGASEGRASERVVSSPLEDTASWTFTTKDERVKRELALPPPVPLKSSHAVTYRHLPSEEREKEEREDPEEQKEEEREESEE